MIRDKVLRKLLVITFFIKISLFLIIFLGYSLFPFCTVCHDKNFVYPKNENISLATAYKTWDAQHYIFLAEIGYSPNQESNAFYPLFPFLIRAFNLFFFKNSLITGMVLSNLFSFVAVIFFYLLVKRIFNARTAFVSSLFLQAFPTAFYMNLVYTESLFLMLVFAFFYFLYHRRFIPLLLTAFLLPLSRAQGVLILVPLIIFLWHDSFRKKDFRLTREYFLFIAFLLGFAVYLGIMFYYTQSFFSGFTSHRYFISSRSLSYLLNPLDWFMRNFVFTKLTLHGFTTSMIDRAFFALFLILSWSIYKHLNRTLFTYALIMGMLPALSDNFMSYTRYLLVVFPIFIILALRLKEEYHFTLIVMFAFQAVLLVAHSLNYWVA